MVAIDVAVGFLQIWSTVWRVSCQSYSGKVFKLLFIKHHYSLCIILQGKPMFSFPHCKVLSCQDLALTGS